MNHTITEFCRKLAQQLLAGLLALVLLLSLGFTLLDSGESVFIQTVSLSPTASTTPAPVEMQMHLTQCSLRLELQLGQRMHFSYQRRLQEV